MQTEPMVFCSQCGQAFRPSEVVTLAGTVVCAPCKPAFLRKLQEDAPTAERRYKDLRRYKGFWIRAVEMIVDGCCLGIVLLPFMFSFVIIPLVHQVIANHGQPVPPNAIPGFRVAMLRFDLGTGLLGLTYNTLMLGRFGATLGDMAIGAKVVTPEGAAIGYGRALARSLMKGVSGTILCIGYLMAAFDNQKRTLHDRVAGTVVVAK